MTYHPQPGTIPHRAVAWLRAQHSIYPDREYPTPELCEALDCETAGFTAFMSTARSHGLVQARFHAGEGKLLFWRLGDGEPVADIRGYARDEELLSTPLPLHVPLHVNREAGPLFPGVSTSPASEAMRARLHAIEWEGKLLVTGMEIRDGVAIFEPEHVQQLKRHTDWWRAA